MNLHHRARPGDAAMLAHLRTLLVYDAGHLYWLRDPEDGYGAEGQAAGTIKTSGGWSYLQVWVDGRAYSEHRLVYFMHHGVWPKLVDHINGDSVDNRIENLRAATKRMNAENRTRAASSNKAGLLGVTVNPSGTFRASIGTRGRVMHLGTFKTGTEAHETYLTAKRLHHSGCTI